MHKLLSYTLKGMIIGGLCFVGFALFHPNARHHHPSIFEIQNRYAHQIQRDILHFLEPIAGPGNVQAMVRVLLVDRQKNTQSTTPLQSLQLKQQHVGILLNQNTWYNRTDIRSTLADALGIQEKLGDTLAIQILPFANQKLWQLGFDKIFLMRLGAVLVLVLLILGITLIVLYHKPHPKKSIQPKPNVKLWKQLLNLSPITIAEKLKNIPPEISAFIIYRLPTESASQIVNFLSTHYMKQVLLHLNHIEKLGNDLSMNLLRNTENYLANFFVYKQPSGHEKASEILQSLKNKTDIVRSFNQSTDNQKETWQLMATCFEDLKKWSPQALQVLLRYVNKELLAQALQCAPLEIHKKIEKNISADQWKFIVQKCQALSYSENDSLKAQNKITQIAKTLIANHQVTL